MYRDNVNQWTEEERHTFTPGNFHRRWERPNARGTAVTSSEKSHFHVVGTRNFLIIHEFPPSSIPIPDFRTFEDQRNVYVRVCLAPSLKKKTSFTIGSRDRDTETDLHSFESLIASQGLLPFSFFPLLSFYFFLLFSRAKWNRLFIAVVD